VARRANGTAERIALDLLVHCPDRMPINLPAISKALGVTKVNYIPMAEDGRVDWNDGQPVISLRADRIRKRQRFTFAHELAHVVLADETTSSAYRIATTDQDDEEAVCDAVAAALLMPRPWLLRRIDAHPTNLDLIRTVAREADVSLAAVAARLTDLTGQTSALLRWTAGLNGWICQFTSAVPSALYGRIRLPNTTIDQIIAAPDTDTWLDTTVTFNGHARTVRAQISTDRGGCLMLITRIGGPAPTART
jgi:hypothetical protein